MPFILEDGQIVGRLIYERLAECPSKIYGQSIESNYQGQGLKLSKHFKYGESGSDPLLGHRRRAAVLTRV